MVSCTTKVLPTEAEELAAPGALENFDRFEHVLRKRAGQQTLPLRSGCGQGIIFTYLVRRPV
jgi:hypothetical protein